MLPEDEQCTGEWKSELLTPILSMAFLALPRFSSLWVDLSCMHMPSRLSTGIWDLNLRRLISFYKKKWWFSLFEVCLEIQH